MSELRPRMPFHAPLGDDAMVHVLLVDDREENLTALEALLEQPHVQVLKASGGYEALELLLRYDVALALIDVHMPGMDGFELAELMRGAQRTRRVPIIFVTAASPESGGSFRGYEAGAVDVLFKPVDPKILQGKVAAFVELFRQRRQRTASGETVLERSRPPARDLASHDQTGGDGRQ